MSSSDSAMFADLVVRVDTLERKLAELAERIEGKELHSELYGEPVNHTADREERRGPGRPPGPRAA